MWFFGKKKRKSEHEIEQIFHQAQEHIKEHRYTAAIEGFNAIRSHNSHDPRWMTGLGQCYFLSTSHHNLSKAYRLLNKACDLHDADAFYYLALLEESQGHVEHAVALLRQAIRNQSVLAMNYLGEIHFNNASYDQACNCFELAHAHQSSTLAFCYLPQIYYHLGYPLKAYDWAKLGTKQGYFTGINTLGDLYLHQNNIDAAIQIYQEAIDFGSIDALNNLGLVHYQEQHYQRAEACFKQALEQHHVFGAHNLATVYEALTHYNQAQKLYAFSFIYHKHFPSLEQLVTIYIHLKDIEQSNQVAQIIKKLKQAENLSKTDQIYLKQLENDAYEIYTAIPHFNK